MVALSLLQGGGSVVLFDFLAPGHGKGAPGVR